MTDKEIQKTVARLKAYAECFKKKMGRTSMMECFENLCDGCTLLYAQGTVGQHLKDIETAIRVLEKEPCEAEQKQPERDCVNCVNSKDGHMDVSETCHICMWENQFMPKFMPSRPMWIPVSDRLPEDNTLVLVTVKVGNREPKVRSGSYYMDGHFHIDNGDCWNSRDKELLAWLPLPEPYKGDEDD